MVIFHVCKTTKRCSLSSHPLRIKPRHFHFHPKTFRQISDQKQNKKQMDEVLPIVALSLLLGAIIAFIFFNTYFRQRKSEVRSITNPNPNPNPNPISSSSKPLPNKKSHPKHHSSDKVIFQFQFSYSLSCQFPGFLLTGYLCNNVGEKTKLNKY